MKTSNQKSVVAMVCASLALFVVICAFSAAQEIRVMPLGDSITKGSSSGVLEENKQVSYRKDLWDKLAVAGYDVDFVGSLTNGEFYEPNGFDPNHEGHGGWRDDEIADNIYNWLTSTPADIVLLHIGTNGLNEDPNDVNDILDEIDRYSEDVIVILARIINRQSYSSTTTNFNDNVEAMAQGRIANGDKIVLVDMEDGADINYNEQPTGDMWDDIHPYATGYAKMADVWFDALDGILATSNCPAGMISYWKMDDTSIPPVIDFYGDNEGACSGTCPDTNSEGIVGTGFDFDGSEYFTVADDNSLDWASDASFSIELWVKFTNVSIRNKVMIGRDENGGVHWWLGAKKDTGLTVWNMIATDGSGGGVTGTTAINDNEWHHIVAVRDNSINKNILYVDGVEDANNTYIYTAGFNAATTLGVGYMAYHLTPDYFYDGLLDEIALYDRALTAQEIGAHYNNGLAGVGYCDNGNTPPVITSTAVTEATVNEPYLYNVDATGNPAPVYLLRESPNDMTIDTNTGLIEWTPSVVNDVNIAVEANNVAGFDIQNFIINVGPASEYPQMTAYWKLNEIISGTYRDSYDSHDGTCAGVCPTPYSNGKVKSAQLFNGSTTGIDVNDSNDFDWGSTDDWTIEFWMKKDVPVGSGGVNDNEVIIGRDDGNLHWWLGVRSYSGGAIHFQLPKVGDECWVIEGPKVDDGRWHHIVAIREGSTESMQLYVDGVDVNSLSSVTTKSFESTVNLNIGWLNLPASYYHYEGLLDEFAIYNRVLTEREILGHYYLARDYGRECSTLVKIMPLGDSITVGNASGVVPDNEAYWVSYRKDLWDVLYDEGYSVDFVGYQDHGYSVVPAFDTNHAGYGGITDNQIAHLLGTGYNQKTSHQDTPGPYLETYPADVILLHIGTNGLDTDPNDVNDILDEIDEYEQNNDTDVTVILARIINCMNHVCPNGSTTTTFNDNIEAMANDRIAQGDKIIIVDMECGADIDYREQPLGNMNDNLHPYETGYAKMADLWFEALETFLPVCGPCPPLITSEPVTQAYLDEPYSYNVEADGVPEPSFLLIESPNDMDINNVTGLITWMPLTVGDFNVVVEANNTEGYDTQNFVVSVNEAPLCPLGISHYWKLDDSGSPYEDYIGNNDATCTDCPTATTGIVNGAQAFNGSNDEVDVADDDTFDWSKDDSFTIEYWMQTNASTSGNRVIVGRDDSSTDLHWWIGCDDNGTVRFQLKDINGNGQYIGGTSPTLNDGQWHLIAAVRDNSINKNIIYVDGNSIDEAIHDYTAGFGSSVPMNIGHLSSGYNYEGTLDEIAVYDKALTVADIQKHYDDGLLGLGYCNEQPTEPNIISTPVTEATQGELYSYDVEADGVPEPNFLLIESPNDMDINNVTGLITWTPLAVGDFNVVVEAANTEGYDTQNFMITVTAPPVCPDNMISYWKMDDTGVPPVTDFYNEHDGSCGGGCPEPNTNGIVNNALYFDGADEVQIADHDDFDWSADDSFSIEVWIKTIQDLSGNKVFIGKYKGGSNMSWWLGGGDDVNDNVAILSVRDSDSVSQTITGDKPLSDGQWHHIVAVRDANANLNYLYVDGVGKSVSKSYSGNFSGTDPVYIGYYINSYHFQGLLDEVAVYKKALTAQEVLDHWNSGSGKSYCSDDADGDGIGDDSDNCPNTYNPDQNDVDGDGVGDLCDGCPNDPNKTEPGICGCGVPDTDSDGDGIADCIDNCPDVNNPDQSNSDSDSFGDLCDNCPNEANPGQDDSDSDGVGTVCDNCPQTSNSDQSDLDDDGIGDLCECYRANIDGINPVNFEDFAKLALNWLKDESEGDTNWDGIVDGLDLEQLVQHWLENCSY